jgi:hypothetical protein
MEDKSKRVYMKTIKSKLLLAVTFFMTVGALTLPFITSAATLVNDIFADGNSQNQDLANNSIRIFNGRAGTIRTDAVGSVTFDTTNAGGSEGFWGYFTDGAPINPRRRR